MTLKYTKRKVKVAQPCLTLCFPKDCSSPGSFLWNSLGKNTGVDRHVLLQGIVPIQGLNPGLPYHRQTLYHLSHQQSSYKKKPSL